MAKRIKDPTERLVMKLFNQGLSNKEIAKKAGIFVSEVKRILKLHQAISHGAEIVPEVTKLKSDQNLFKGTEVNPTIIEEMYTGGTLVEFKNGNTLIQKDNDMVFLPGGGLVGEGWKVGPYDTNVQTSSTSPLTVDIYSKELSKLMKKGLELEKKTGLDYLFDRFKALADGFACILGLKK